MASASTPIIQTTIPILPKEPYVVWSIKMRTLLTSQGLWEFVEGGYQKLENQKEYTRNQRKDAKALYFLQQGVDPAIFSNIMSAKTSQEAWKILESKFKGSDKVSKEKNKKGHPSAPKKLVIASNTASASDEVSKEKNKKGDPSAPKKLVTASKTASAPSTTSPKGGFSNGKRNNPDEAVADDAAVQVIKKKKKESEGIPKEISRTIRGLNRKFQLIDYKKLCTCDGCKMQATGRIYHSEQGNLNLHINCMFPKSTVTLDSNGDTFKFVEELPCICRKGHCRVCHRRCEVCAKPAEGYVYYCEKDNRNVHPCCINIPKQLQIDELEFELTGKEQSKKCMLCTTKTVEGSVSGNRGWFYVSKCTDDRWFHAFCSTKMLLEEWEKADPNDKNHLPVVTGSLDNATLKIKPLLKQKRKKGEIYWKIFKKIVVVLMSIFIGDPTTVVVSLVLGLVD